MARTLVIPMTLLALFTLCGCADSAPVAENVAPSFKNKSHSAGRVDVMPTIEFPASSSGTEGSSGDPLWDLLTADAVAQITIDAVVSDAPFTNASPPKLRITVGEIVRGEIAERRIEAFWLPPPHQIDWGGEDEPALIAWKQSAFPPPKPATQWIATYYGPDSSMHSDRFPCIGHRFPYTAEKLAWTRNYIEQQIAARRRREQERQRERERIRKADLEVEKKASLKQLYDGASDIVVAKRVSAGVDYMSFMIERRVKDSRDVPADKEKFLEVSGSKNDEAMITARLTSEYAANLDRMLLFLRVIPSTRDHPPSHLDNVDRRLFEFVDPGNGVLVATDERLNELKSLASGK